jgi:hypothetical protein
MVVVDAFNKTLDDIADRIHYVNLLANTGTVLGSNALHAIVLKPHSSNDLIPFDTCENCSYTGNKYEKILKR